MTPHEPVVVAFEIYELGPDARADGPPKVIHRFDVGPLYRTPRAVDKIEDGLLMRVDLDRYSYRRVHWPPVPRCARCGDEVEASQLAEDPEAWCRACEGREILPFRKGEL